MSQKTRTYKLDKYDIIDKIGEGSYGFVYLVKDKQTGKEYAAKISKDPFDPKKNISFSYEKEVYLKLKNPAVLSLFEYSFSVFNHEKYPTLIIEYMPNKSLKDLLKSIRSSESTIPSSKLYIILLGLALGMKYLHSHGIIHRDMKPDNILLDDKLYPHICDFGESYETDIEISQTKMQDYKGTPQYMAPEMFTDDYYTYKVDVYAFSLIAYELLTGKKPYEKIEYSQRYINNLTMELIILNYIRTIILRICKFIPAYRLKKKK